MGATKAMSEERPIDICLARNILNGEFEKYEWIYDCIRTEINVIKDN